MYVPLMMPVICDNVDLHPKQPIPEGRGLFDLKIVHIFQFANFILFRLIKTVNLVATNLLPLILSYGSKK